MKKKSMNEADSDGICRAEFFFKDHDVEEWIQ
jgi:hypothetical protein